MGHNSADGRRRLPGPANSSWRLCGRIGTGSLRDRLLHRVRVLALVVHQRGHPGALHGWSDGREESRPRRSRGTDLLATRVGVAAAHRRPGSRVDPEPACRRRALMDLSLSPKAKALLADVRQFMSESVYPAEPV